MIRWQYAWLRDDQQGLSVFFSHPQGPGLVAELTAILGPMLFAQQSTEWVLSLDRSRVNLPYFCGLLGDRGWEMLGVENSVMPGTMGQNVLNTAFRTTLYFKRQVE